MKNVMNLLKDIEKKKGNWDERSCFAIKGVRGLTVADLDTIELYAETYARTDGVSFDGLMKPRGAVASVLKAYGIEVTKSGLWD